MIIGLLCFVTMQAQELSWDWWPTGFSDSCEQRTRCITPPLSKALHPPADTRPRGSRVWKTAK